MNSVFIKSVIYLVPTKKHLAEMHWTVVVQAFIPSTQGGRGRQMFGLRGQPGLQSESAQPEYAKKPYHEKNEKKKNPPHPLQK